MTTTILITTTTLSLIILAIIAVFIFKSRDERLRKWCLKQASSTNLCNHVDDSSGISYSTEADFVSLAEKYYLFLTEHITYLSQEEKTAIFPEKWKKKED